MSVWQKIIKKIRDFSDEYELLKEGDRLLVGVSGGPDSVLLTEILCELAPSMNLSCHLAHVNYALRGEDSDGDQKFVEQLASKKNWPVEVLSPVSRVPLRLGSGQAGPESCVDAEVSRVPVHELHSQKNDRGNFQDWARRVRYQFFSDECEKWSLNKIAVAHHLDDQVETFFLRLLRGSGLKGMASMRPCGESYGKELIRPMLCLSRTEIEDVLKERGLSYRFDKTNELNQYRRNRLRQEVLPILNQIQPGFEQALGENLLIMQEEDQLLDDLAIKHIDQLRNDRAKGLSEEVILSRKILESLPKILRLRVLRQVIGELTGGLQSITFHHVNKMAQLLERDRISARYDLPGGLLYEQGPHVIIIRRK